MRTYLITTIITLIIAIILMVIYITSRSTPSSQDTTQTTPLPSPSISPLQPTFPHSSQTETNQLSPATSPVPLFTIVDIKPQDEATDIDQDTNVILMTADIPINESMITFEIYPYIPHTMNVDGRMVTITLEQQLEEGVRYLYIARPTANEDIGYAFSFTVEGTAPTAYIPEYNSGEVAKRAKEYTQTHRPDLHLANELPYTSPYFHASKALQRQPVFHYAFTFHLRGSSQEEAEARARAWMNEIGLTNEQIEELDITFIYN